MHEVERAEGDEDDPERDKDQRGEVLAAAAQLVAETPGEGEGEG